MGCDIHMFLEERINDQWVFIREIDIYRSYTLFGRLAGIRDRCIDPISYPRSMPDDASIFVKAMFKYWGDDAHTPSWFFLRELLNDNFLKNNYSDVLNEIIYCVSYYGTSISKSNYRLIFWFDN